MKSVPSSMLTRQTTSFILPFFTSRRGDWKMEVWPSSPVPCSPSSAPSGSFFSSSVASSSFVTLASSGLSWAPSFSSFGGWRSGHEKHRVVSDDNHTLCSALRAQVSWKTRQSVRSHERDFLKLTVFPKHPKSETFLTFGLLDTVGVPAGSFTKLLMSLGGSGWLHAITG